MGGVSDNGVMAGNSGESNDRSSSLEYDLESISEKTGISVSEIKELTDEQISNLAILEKPGGDEADIDDLPTTAYTVRNIPEGMWKDWQLLVPRNKNLGERIIKLTAADLAADRKHHQGVIELLLSEDLLTQDEITKALKTIPDN
jgi:hypothetical protein